MGDYEIRDNWGRRIGTARPIGQDSGCNCLILLGLALIGVIMGIGFLIQGFVNLAVYHTFSPNFAALTAEAGAPAYEGNAVSAKKSGKVSLSNSMGSQAVEFGSDGAITFDGFDLSETGPYYLCIDGTPPIQGQPLMIDIIADNKLTKVDARNSFYSSSPTSCVSSIIIHLNKGVNSIRISVDKNNYCYPNTGCPTVIISDIRVAKKS